jgi:hypothetical protein
MARKDVVDEVETVDTEVETVEAPEGEKPAKAKKEPARGELPEGYVTPVQFSKIVTERELHTDKNGGHAVAPQMVYSYIKNSPEADKFPVTTVTDSIGKERQALLVEDGIAWWERKNERVNTRRANAAEKAEKKAARATAKEAEGVTEAEAVDEAE